MNIITKAASALVIIGALNWGLVAVSPDYNLVEMLFGGFDPADRIIYGLVGLSGLHAAYEQFTSMRNS